jgi:hypothetical protein
VRARLEVLTIVIFGTLATPLRAELYEFEVKGTVVGGLLPLYQVVAGDEITFRYVMDSTDSDPDPLIGQYAGTTAFFETPAGTFSGDPLLGGDFTVTPFGQFASFDSFIPNPIQPHVKLSFRFPAGTLLSDELPLTLPVSTATTRSFFVHPFGLTPSLYGTITSYESRLMPEPYSLCLIGVAGAALRRRRS